MKEERQRGGASESDLPGSVSSQNREEARPGHGDGDERRDRGDGPRERSEESGGEASEGTQSTGNPASAG